MIRSINHLHGDKLHATDGQLGHVKDFYFDDQNWVIRYVVADTGSWLTERQVLIPPHSFVSVDQNGKVLGVNLSKKQIEDSPSIDSHKPVSRQYEEEYYRYFGWPFYWQGDVMWGVSGAPAMELPLQPMTNEPWPSAIPKPGAADSHLRSAQAVSGYHIKARDGTIGHVSDFMLDDQTWAIGQLVVKTGNRFSGKEVLVATAKVERISYEESTVYVDLTMSAIEHGPTPHLASDGTAQ